MTQATKASAAAVFLVFLSATALSARAQLMNQPKPSPEAITAIQQATRDILGTGDLGVARPALFLAVEKVPGADMTDLLAGAVQDDTTFSGLLSTLEDAVRKSDGGTNDNGTADYARYNLARLYLLRSRFIRSTPERAALLAPAIRVAKTLSDGKRGAEVSSWELLGDLYAAAGESGAATGAYQKIDTIGAGKNRARMYYRIAQMYHRGNDYSKAQQAYESAIRADAVSDNPGGELLHRLYQGLAASQLSRGNDPAALAVLSESVRRVKQNPENAFHPQTDVAILLLRRGHAKEVLAYADAALRLDADNLALQQLRDAAKAAASARR